MIATEEGSHVFRERTERLLRHYGEGCLQDLGHRHATPGLRVGLHPNVVSERLGRANTAITLDTHSDAMSAMLAEAASRIAASVVAASRSATN
jgi:hypothetical protein